MLWLATPMRGKSPTCRHAHFINWASTLDGQDQYLKKTFGKSETCRASEWQSQHAVKQL
jgi:hypothetical protein